jgi:hypothetical protein
MWEGRYRLLLLLGGCLLAGGAALLVAWDTFSSDGMSTNAPRATTLATTMAEVPAKKIAVVSTSDLPAASQPAAADAAPDAAKDLLDEAERNYLWEVEHHTNILMDVAFKRAADHLAKADVQGLTEMLAESFTAELPDEAKSLKHDSELVQFQRARIDQGDPVSADADQFVAALLAYRGLFQQKPKAKLSVMGLAPQEGRQALDGLWKGTCLLRMWGEADPGQPTEVSLQIEYIVPRPEKQLAQTGRWLQSCKVLQAQVSHSSRFLMRPAGEEKGIDVKRWWDNWSHLEEQRMPITDTGSVNLCDFNRDGCVDMLVTDVTGLAFYQGSPAGKFRDVAAEVGLLNLPARGVLTLFADLNGDGWEDLLLGNLLLRNEEGKRFSAVTNCKNLGVIPTVSNVSTVDYNLDGKLDLYFVVGGVPKGDSWVKGHSGRSHGNQLLMNLGNWQFKDVSKTANAEGGFRSVFTATWLDANNDGRPDVHVPNEFGNGVLLVNQEDGTFKEHSLTPGPSDFGTMGLTVGDFNNDGNIDIYCANMYSKAGNRVIGNLRPDAYPENIMALMNTYTKGSQLYRNRGNLNFERVGAEFQVADVGWAYGPCLADLDNDGFLDIHATAGFISVDPDEPDG